MTNTGHTQQRLRVGAASVDVTPPIGICMQGYGMRHAEAITDRLLVSALAVGSRRTDWLLLSVDCIGLDRVFTTRVREMLARSLEMPASAITIACSHTHSGPATLPNLGAVEADTAYLAFLERQMAVAAESAAQRLENVRWRLGTTSLPENVNRREWKGGSIELGADPRGPVDSRLRVVRIDRITDSSPSPLALIVHYACHATSSGGVPSISADWPGAMRTVLQTIYGNDKAPVVCFLQGCAGDVTHRIACDPHSWPEHFGQYTSVQSDILGRLTAAAALNASERSVGLRADAVEVIIQPLSLSYHRHPASEETEAQVVRIGPVSSRHDSAEQSMWIVALPGEPFTTYGTNIGDRLHRQLGTAQNSVLVCGYSNDAVGYLCTPQALREGGYEAAQAHKMYHRPAAFSAATQALVFDRVSEATTQLTSRAREDHSTEGAMLTVFATPKPFRGHIAVIQRNAIRSWTLLRPACEIILMGNEEGTAEIAVEYGLRHISDVARNTFGTPLVSDLFKQAEQSSARNFFCYVNSDIILMSDFMQAIQRVADQKNRFLLVGHRWNLDVTKPFEFRPDWEETLRNQVRTFGTLAGPSSIDFFVFPRGVLGAIPPFAIGRVRWDNWMLYRARSLRMPLIDATPVVMAVHQNHDYSHHPQGRDGTRNGDEALANATLAGDALHLFAITDATHLLTPQTLRLTYDRDHLLRHCATLPILYPWRPLRWMSKVVSMSRPLRARFGLTLNSMLRRPEN